MSIANPHQMIRAGQNRQLHMQSLGKCRDCYLSLIVEVLQKVLT
jgi:hypothetical protein